jgi:hypothetical protein
MGTKVTSTVTCFYHGRRFRPGEVFELPEGVKPSADMQVVEEKAELKVKPQKGEVKGGKVKAEGPQTFSEIAKHDGQAQAPKGADDLV